MVHKETKAKEIQVTVREWCTCDWCGEVIQEEPYGTYEGEVRLRTGKSYPDNGSAKEIRADLCCTCFTDRLLPLLRDQGVKFQEEKTEW